MINNILLKYINEIKFAVMHSYILVCVSTKSIKINTKCTLVWSKMTFFSIGDPPPPHPNLWGSRKKLGPIFYITKLIVPSIAEKLQFLIVTLQKIVWTTSVLSIHSIMSDVAYKKIDISTSFLRKVENNW